MDEKQLLRISKRLDIAINLFLEKRQKENNYSDEDQVLYLSTFKLAPSEMAALLAKSPNAVRILLTRLRKKGRLK
jgi:hypothetical protein